LHVFLAALFMLFSSVSQGQEWTRFRGPNGQGISYAKTIPVKWTEKDYNWKIELPGGGYSSPVLWVDKLFITSGDQKAAQSTLLTINAPDGKVLWQKEYKLSKYHPNKLNSFASATPAVDAENAYILFTCSVNTGPAARQSYVMTWSYLHTSMRTAAVKTPEASGLRWTVKPARHAGHWTEKPAPKPLIRHPAFIRHRMVKNN